MRSADPSPSRSDAYRLLAEAFLPPRDDLRPDVLAEALAEAVLQTRGSALAGRIGRLRTSVDRTAIPDLRREYQRLFLGPGKPAAPAYESAYRGAGWVMGPWATEMEQLLARSDRRVSRDLRLLPDHVSVELALAADLAEMGRAEPLRALQEDHLAEWLPAFSRQLEAASAHPYFVELAKLSDRLVGIDLAGEAR